MSFNIRCASAQDGVNGWDYRKSSVIDRIRAFNPHLIGLQECRDDDQAQYIKSSLEDYEFIGIQRGGDSDTSIEMAPVLYKRGFFEELERGHFWLSKTPDIPGSLDWGGAFPRTASWVRLSEKSSFGAEIVFINTHFDYKNEQVIYQSAKLLRAWIDELGNVPLILTGDFNTTKDAQVYGILVNGNKPHSRPLVDTHNQNEGTYHGFGRSEKKTAIDWILVSEEFAILSSDIDKYHLNALYPSDHYPLLCEIFVHQS